MLETDMLAILWAISALMIVAVGATYVPGILIKRHGLAALSDRVRGKLALTYDDGPDPSLTARLLELLQLHRARATFFLVGFRALRSPQVCKRLKESGHELGCHTSMHRNGWRIAPWEAALDVKRGFDDLAEWLPPNAPFRPPFGKLTLWTWLAARWRGASVCWWTLDGCDTHPVLPDMATVVDRVVQNGGGVVLLHSHDRGTDREEYVLKLTDELLRAARRHGWQVCSMGELTCAPEPVLE